MSIDDFEYTLTRKALRQIKAEAWEEGWIDRDNDCSEPYSPRMSNPYRDLTTTPDEGTGPMTSHEEAS